MSTGADGVPFADVLAAGGAVSVGVAGTWAADVWAVGACAADAWGAETGAAALCVVEVVVRGAEGSSSWPQATRLMKVMKAAELGNGGS